MQVRFWGVRGSCPTPAVSEDVAARLEEALWRLGQESSAIDLSNRTTIARWVESLPPTINGLTGGNTPCVEVRTAAGDLIIIDMGSGLRALGRELMNSSFGRGQGEADVLLSHFHWDHIQGWPFFIPAYVAGNRFRLYTSHPADLEEHLCRQQEAPFFPPSAWDDMAASITYEQIKQEPLVLCDGRVRVTTIELVHPSSAFSYRIEADGAVFVYASDATYEMLDDTAIQKYVDFYCDADLLVFDAQFTLAESIEKRLWGHSTSVVGVDLCCRAGVKRMALFHHDPAADDAKLENMRFVAQEYGKTIPDSIRRRVDPLELILAREGLKVNL